MSFSVLYVCTGNVCRSPMAELLFGRWTASNADVLVFSAGVRALTGQGIDQGSAAALRGVGLDPSHHRARQFEGWMARDVDLVLTAERAHRDEIMQTFPPAFRRTFTMKEFARAAAQANGRDPLEVVAAAARVRHLAGEVPLAEDDMPDPFGASEQESAGVLAEIAQSVRTTVAALGLARPAAPATSAAPAAGPAPQNRPSPHRPLAGATRRPLPYKR